MSGHRPSRGFRRPPRAWANFTVVSCQCRSRVSTMQDTARLTVHGFAPYWGHSRQVVLRRSASWNLPVSRRAQAYTRLESSGPLLIFRITGCGFLGALRCRYVGGPPQSTPLWTRVAQYCQQVDLVLLRACHFHKLFRRRHVRSLGLLSTLSGRSASSRAQGTSQLDAHFSLPVPSDLGVTKMSSFVDCCTVTTSSTSPSSLSLSTIRLWSRSSTRSKKART